MNNPTVIGLYWTKLKFSNSRHQTKFEYIDYWDGSNWYGTWVDPMNAVADIINGDCTTVASLYPVHEWKLYKAIELIR